MFICIIILFILSGIGEFVCCYGLNNDSWDDGEPDLAGCYTLSIALMCLGMITVWLCPYKIDFVNTLWCCLLYSCIGLIFSFIRGILWIFKVRNKVYNKYKYDKYETTLFKDSAVYNRAKCYFLAMIKIWALLWPFHLVLLLTKDFINWTIELFKSLYNSVFDNLFSKYESKKIKEN